MFQPTCSILTGQVGCFFRKLRRKKLAFSTKIKNLAFKEIYWILLQENNIKRRKLLLSKKYLLFNRVLIQEVERE
ncbi:hypothetical protein BBF96_00565 [Anoxybacter fermentans]|uniref:Uncharacterized protein n=1 Tax=Anoxybacter fermentans TaxID=1323375 RepID=A0A3Q9HNE2_9FIRM|nr:hypothetical protein BBF96_00565 [Anoxybacter fermentans]